MPAATTALLMRVAGGGLQREPRKGTTLSPSFYHQPGVHCAWVQNVEVSDYGSGRVAATGRLAGGAAHPSHFSACLPASGCGLPRTQPHLHPNLQQPGSLAAWPSHALPPLPRLLLPACSVIRSVPRLSVCVSTGNVAKPGRSSLRKNQRYTKKMGVSI